jgi:hypothetical protein
MNRLKVAYRTHRPDLMLAWAGATVIVLFVSLLIEALR